MSAQNNHLFSSHKPRSSPRSDEHRATAENPSSTSTTYKIETRNYSFQQPNMTLYSSRSPYKDEVQYPTLSSSSIGRPAVWTPQCCRQRAASPSDQVSGVNMSPELPCDPHASLPPEKEMAPRPKKPLTLAQIRAEGTAFRAAAMPAAKGSAFYALTQKNNAFLNGTTRRDEFNRKRNDDDDVCSPAAKKTFKTVCNPGLFPIRVET